MRQDQTTKAARRIIWQLRDIVQDHRHQAVIAAYESNAYADRQMSYLKNVEDQDRKRLLDLIKELESNLTEVIDSFEASVDRAWRSVQRKVEQLRVEELDLLGSFDPRGWFVYQLFSGDEIIYVGQSRNIMGRIGSHLNDPRKGYLIDEVKLFRCPSEEAMCVLESELIAQLRPQFNTQGVPA